MVARCTVGCRPELGGSWVPAFVGKTRARKAEAQEPRWGRCHGTDLSAAGFLLARCLSTLEKAARSVLRRLRWFDIRLVAAQGSVVLDSGVRGEDDERARCMQSGFPRERGGTRRASPTVVP